VIKIKIAVVYNTSKSKQTKEVENNLFDMAKSVSKALAQNGHIVSLVNADDNLILNLNKEKPDFVFNMAERFNGNPNFTPHVAGLLEMNNIHFTGASSYGFLSCDNKLIAKLLMQHHGINTPKFQVFESASEKLNQTMNFPLIVKPSNAHDSIGITNDSVVNNKKELKLKVDYILEYLKQNAIVEEFINGREFNVAVLGNNNPYTLPICEVDFSKNSKRVLGYEMKWFINWYKEAPILCPANISKPVQEKLKQISIAVHKKLGLRDYSRIDFRLDNADTLYVLEVNANPGLTEDCFIYHAAKVAGIDYNALISRILHHATERYKPSVAVEFNEK